MIILKNCILFLSDLTCLIIVKNWTVSNVTIISCVTISARALPSCRATLAVMGFFGGIVISLLRNNLSVGIVCMTIDGPTDQNNASGSNETNHRLTESRSLMNILFPNTRRSSSYHYFRSDDFEDCPNDPSSDPAYEAVSEFVCFIFRDSCTSRKYQGAKDFTWCYLPVIEPMPCEVEAILGQIEANIEKFGKIEIPVSVEEIFGQHLVIFDHLLHCQVTLMTTITKIHKMIEQCY